MLKFNLVHVTKHEYEIRAEVNGKYIGRAVMDVDGYFYIDLLSNGGVWSHEALIGIGTVVAELNKGMDDHLKKYMEENGE